MGISPEYPHSPAHHLNSPTIMSTRGMMTHCEVDFRAGQKKDASGKAGDCLFVFESRTIALSLLAPAFVNALCFFLGR